MKKRKKIKKGTILIGIIIGITLILLVTPILSILQLTTPTTCKEDGYNNDCFCQSGERRIYVPWAGIPRWNCEEIESLLIDPESPTFEDDAVNFVENYLQVNCGDICTDLSCGDVCKLGDPLSCTGDFYISPAYGYGSTGARLVNIECREVLERDEQGRETKGRIPWRMEFFVESETGTPVTYDIFQNYCTNPDRTERCDVPMEYRELGTLSIFEPKFDSVFETFE